ncbi:hypothetical protein [Pedobacter glucosidilyticus]|uniref:hypothetical protein n=1 Tax=Pedobacter glucosidilyticus TaxID=1122941 RepID=UPI00041ED4F9|nr:hypothetical protein [Pedobacter glucosidilyticus]
MKFGKISFIILICALLITHTLVLNIWLSGDVAQQNQVSFKKYNHAKDSLIQEDGRLINYKNSSAPKIESISVSR